MLLVSPRFELEGVIRLDVVGFVGDESGGGRLVYGGERVS